MHLYITATLVPTYKVVVSMQKSYTFPYSVRSYVHAGTRSMAGCSRLVPINAICHVMTMLLS